LILDPRLFLLSCRTSFIFTQKSQNNIFQVVVEPLRLPQFRSGSSDFLPDFGRRDPPGRAGHLRAGEMFLDVAEFVAVLPPGPELRQVDGVPPHPSDGVRGVSRSRFTALLFFFSCSLFLALDVNRDGHVDFKELCCGISAACRGPTAERMKCKLASRRRRRVIW
jgi:hypothetical protein